jgi:hypothetical protein
MSRDHLNFTIGETEKMDSLANDYPTELLNAHEPPCLSLYQPTSRTHPENQQDPIRFCNLVKAMEESLRQKYPMHEIQPLLAPFQALADDYYFWNHTLDGLAVLNAPGMFRVYRLQRPVAELAIVADSFHIKPLIRILQSADRYQILGLSRKEIKLFEGNRDVLDMLEPAPGVPRTVTEVVGEELKEPHLLTRAYGTGAASAAIHQGQGSGRDLVDNETEQFFRAVDRAVLEHHSRPSGLPLLLAALPEHRSAFQQLSRNPFLMRDGIDLHPNALSIEELRRHAWQALEPQYLARLAKLIDTFMEARSKGLGSDNLADAAEATVAGRVATLLVEADREIPGRIDPTTGQIEFDKLAHPEVDDLLDDLSEWVLRKSGEVVIVPAEQMPTRTGIAATYRF